MESLLRRDEVLRRTGLSRSALFALISTGKFPAPIPLASSRAKAWVESEVTRWVLDQIKAARGVQPDTPVTME